MLAALGLLGASGVSHIQEAAEVADSRLSAPATAERAAQAVLTDDHRTLAADRAAAGSR